MAKVPVLVIPPLPVKEADSDTIGIHERLTAALAVAKEQFPRRCIAALFYRLAELCTNAVLPAGMCWVVDPCFMAPVFLAFWYAPAAIRAHSWVKPLRQPILCFVVDDVSLLSIHPNPRSARGMYAICIFRLLLLLSVVPMLHPAAHHLSPLGEEFGRQVVNERALQQIGKAFQAGGNSLLATFWLFCFTGVLAMSVAWGVVTAYLLSFTAVFDGTADRRLLKVIDELAADLHRAAQLSPWECHKELRRIKASRHPGLGLANLLNCVGPAWAVVLHFAMDVGFVLLHLFQGSFTLAIPLAFFVCASLAYFHRHSAGLVHLPGEVLLSLRRGLVTKHWMEGIRGDKGVLRIPETVLKVYGLPLAVGSPRLFAVVAGAGAVGSNVALVAKFIFTEWDLGVESMGMQTWVKGS